MQIVIDIPEKLYKECLRLGDSKDILFEAIRNCQILPKGHGRLIDAEALNLHNISPCPDDNFLVYGVTSEDIDLVPTIIEKDSIETNV